MSHQQTILVIDDQFEILDMLRSLLEIASPGCRVLTVPSAEEALLELGQIDIDLVICDLQLPGMDGLAFSRLVKQRQPATPLIMMSAYTSSARTQEANGLGVLRFFSKPLDMETLLEMVRDVLHVEELPPASASEPNPAAATSPGELLEQLRGCSRAAAVFLTHNGRVLETSGRIDETALTNAPEPPFDAAVRIELGPTGTWCATAVLPDYHLLIHNPASTLTLDDLSTAVQSTAAALTSLIKTTPPEPPPAEPEPSTPLPEDPQLTALLENPTGSAESDNFWQEALVSEKPTDTTNGFSYEEAKARGLLPPDWA